MYFKVYKEVITLPEILEPNSLYFVRVRNGFDLYCSDSTASFAHKLNTDVIVSPTSPLDNSLLWVDTSVTNSPVLNKYSQTIGDGINTEFTINHNLNTLDVVVNLFSNESPYSMVMTDIDKINANSLKVLFFSPPLTNQYRITIIG